LAKARHSGRESESGVASGALALGEGDVVIFLGADGNELPIVFAGEAGVF
jgi:hypothetical protein